MTGMAEPFRIRIGASSMIHDPFLRRLSVAAGILLLIGGSVYALVSSVSLHPFGVPEPLRDEFKRKTEAIKAAAAAIEKGELERLPRARIVGSAEFQFGYMDPSSQATHTFVIENVGGGDLVLESGETTCKCTLSEVGQRAIAPGERGEVTLIWNSGSKQQSTFAQTAIVRTNDPTQPELQLRVAGKIRAKLRTDPDELSFSSMAPDETREVRARVFSQVWPEFDIESIDVDQQHEGSLKWSVLPLDAESLQKLEAKSGYVVTVTLTSGQLQGPFQGVLRLGIRPTELPDEPENAETVAIATVEDAAIAGRPEPEGEEAEPGQIDQINEDGLLVRELMIRGNVVDRIAFFGSNLDDRTGLDMGVVDTVDGYETKVIMRIRGDRQPERLAIGKRHPEFLEASIEPMSNRKGFYTLTVRVPRGSPVDVFNTDAYHGFVAIDTDLSETGLRVLPVYGAVTDRTRSLSQVDQKSQ
jgi:nucleotide-binding universal stress UspA family protein